MASRILFTFSEAMEAELTPREIRDTILFEKDAGWEYGELASVIIAKGNIIEGIEAKT